MKTWQRYELKARAKKVLKVNYWVAFVVALILSITISGSSGSISSSFNFEYGYDETSISNFFESISDTFNNISLTDNQAHAGEFGEFIRSLSPAIIITSIIAITVIILFAVAFRVFILNQLQVGCQKFFVTSAVEPHKNMKHLGLAFRAENYFHIVKAMFLRDLYIFLWSLLLIIPSIIKSYSYRMVPYILTENPKMNPNEAITLSRQMMSGQKWKAFLLDLSFIGWYLLGMLAFGIGVLFVNPYKYSTDAQLYIALK